MSLIILVMSTVVSGDVKSNNGSIPFDVDNSGTAEAILNTAGLGLGVTPTEALQVEGNALILSDLTTGNVTLSGTMKVNIETQMASGLISGANGQHLIDTQGQGNLLIQLPGAAAHEGKVLKFKKLFSGNQLLLSSVTKIDEQDYELEIEDGEYVDLISNGVYWYIINQSAGISLQNASSSNLQLHLSLDTDLSNLSPEVITATLEGNTYANASITGVSGNGLYLDGVDDYIEIDYTSEISLDGSFSLSFWVKPSSNALNLGAFSGFSNLTAQSTFPGADDPGEISFTAVGNSFKFASFMHSGGTETSEYAESDLSFNGINWNDFSTDPNGTNGNESSSVVVNSDGNNLYFAAFAHNGNSESFYTATSNLDFSGFSGWDEREAPDGSGGAEPSFIDMLIVDDQMIVAAYLHNGSVEAFSFASANLDGSGNFIWEDSFSPQAGGVGGGGESTTVGIDTNGEKVYYALLASNGSDPDLYFATTDLDGSNYTLTSELALPSDVTQGNYSSHISLVQIGHKIHYGALFSDNMLTELYYSYSDLDGSNLNSWTALGNVLSGDPTQRETVSLDMLTTGENLYFLAYANKTSGSDNLLISHFPLNSQPILSKEGVFTLHYTHGGLILDYDGARYKYGNLSSDSFNHVGLTFDGSEMAFYVDGEQVQKQSTPIGMSTSASNILLGSNGSHFFKGSVDDIRFFDRSVDSDEMKTIFEAEN